MNTKTKTLFVILGTFILGLIIGGLGSHLYYRYKVNQIVSMRSPQQIFHFVERLIQPSPKQRAAIRDILQKHGRVVLENMRENREKQLQQFQSLKDDLQQILTPEQMQRLEHHLRRRQRPLRPFPPPQDKRMRGPRGGGPGRRGT